METKQFLSENRLEVISYFNDEISKFWNISLKDFMVDLMNNFRKISTKEEYTRMDLIGNLKEAKSRLGVWDSKIEITYSKPYSESNHAKAVAYHGKDKVQMMSNAN